MNLDTIEPNLAAALPPVVFDGPAPGEPVPVIQLPPGSELAAGPDALVLPPGAPPAGPDGAWAPVAELAAPAPVAPAPVAPAPVAPAPVAPREDAALEAQRAANERSAQAQSDLVEADATAARNALDVERAEAARLAREEAAKAAEHAGLQQRYEAAAAEQIDPADGIREQYGSGVGGGAVFALHALLSGLFGNPKAFSERIDKMQEQYVQRAAARKRDRLAAIDQQVGYAGAGLDALRQQVRAQTGAMLRQQAAVVVGDARKGALVTAALAERDQADARALGDRQARQAAEADRAFARSMQKQQLDLQREQHAFGRSMAMAQLQQGAEAAQLKQVELAQKRGADLANAKVTEKATVAQAVAQLQQADDILARGAEVNRAGGIKNAAASGVAKVQGLFGVDEPTMTDEQKFRMEIQPVIGGIFHSLNGALTKEDVARMDAMSLNQLMAYVKDMQEKLRGGITTQAKAAGTSYDDVLARLGSAQRVK